MRKTRSRRLPKAVRPEEFKQLVLKIPKKNLHHKVAFLLAYGSGMRISEVLRCQGDHFRKNQIFIPESKYGLERIVPVPKAWRENFFKFLPFNITPRALQKAFKKYASKANLNPRYSFHSLRHGFATRCIEGGVPLNQLQALLGHSNISTTNVYIVANPLDAIKSYEELF